MSVTLPSLDDTAQPAAVVAHDQQVWARDYFETKISPIISPVEMNAH